VKIVILNNLYSPNVRGGAERSVQLLAETLVRGGSAVTVVTTGDEGPGVAEVDGVRVVTVGGGNVYWPFHEQRASYLQRRLWHLVDTYNPFIVGLLAQLMRGERADVVHTNNLQGISVAAWRAAEVAGLPVLHTLRDYYLACARATCFRDGRNCERTCLECLPFSALRRVLSRRIAGVVGTSRFILDRHLQAGFFRDSSLRKVIHNPSPDRVKPRGARGEGVTFGYLGRIEESKGLGLLLRSFAGRSDTIWKLLIAGRGPEEFLASLRRQASGAVRPEQIHFLGWTDAADFLARVDVVVVPSLWHEPLPRVAIEAQSNGVVVVGSRRGGIPEVVADGVNGLLFEPDETGSLSAAVGRLLENRELIERLSAATSARAQGFRPEVVAREYLDAYQAVVAAHRGGRNA
jgi:glycosyltransferase involved in cell wall biosynthesis